jgi:serine/threonine-protein kinase RsbW
MKLEYIKKISLKDVPRLTQDILQKIGPYCPDEDCIFDIRLALEEALVNAVKYGNNCDNNKDVIVKLNVDANSLTIEVKDQGEGFDFENLSSPVDSENLEKLSGRGVFLIKNTMDEVEFLDNGSRVRMVKTLNK